MNPSPSRASCRTIRFSPVRPGDEHMGDHAFGQQHALDQSSRRRRLDDSLHVDPAGTFRPHGDVHSLLRRHDVQALAPVLAGPAIFPQPHRQSRLSRSITRSILGRCSGKRPILRRSAT